MSDVTGDGSVDDRGVGHGAALEVASVSKSFNGVCVLDNVSLTVRAGTVHGLVGHNGSGKSTFIKVLAGFYQPDVPVEGRVFGTPFAMGDHQAADAVGIRFVHQDLALVDALSATDNVAIGTGYPERHRALIDWRLASSRARELIHSLGFDFDVSRPVGELSAAQRTGVAIARALQQWSGERAVIVLDEPTAAMPAKEAQVLFEAVRRLRSQGLGVIYVSHHLAEVLDLADEVTVLRSGKVHAHRPTSGLDHDELVQLLVGHTEQQGAQSLPQALESVAPDSRIAMSATQVDSDELSGFSVQVRAGEIVGIAGVDGSGRNSVAPALTGNLPRTGAVEVGGTTIPAGRPREAIRAGVGYVPAYRLKNAIIPDLDATSNLTIADLKPFQRFHLLSSRAEAAEGRAWLRRLAVNEGQAKAPVLTLSGGTQQKVMLARWLRRQPQVLVLDEPTQGVDVGARQLIYEVLEGAARAGSGILVCSSDTEELVQICDRVIVLVQGRIRGELTKAELSVDAVDALALSTTDRTSS